MTTDRRADAALDPERFVYLPDPPDERRWDGMVFDHLSRNGNAHYLLVHLRKAVPHVDGQFSLHRSSGGRRRHRTV